MQHEPLEYATPRSREEKLPLVLAAVAPFVMVPVYFIGTVLLQDSLINGDGRSWYRAALRMAIPTGLVTAAALVVGVLGLIRAAPSRPAAIVATVASALALAFIVYGTATA